MYLVLARNIATDWCHVTDGVSLEEAKTEAAKAKKTFDIVRIYRFIEGDI